VGGAIVALALSAAVIDAAASSSPGTAPVEVVRPSTHPRERASLQAPRPSSGSKLEQTVQLTIDGGELDLQMTAARVQLTRVNGSDHEWSGALPAVRVVDARGTLEGWEVRWRLHSVVVDSRGPVGLQVLAATVEVQPGPTVVVEGDPQGVYAPGGPVATSRPGVARSRS
jgi:hypothetical protein